jgi:hypothetical protein
MFRLRPSFATSQGFTGSCCTCLSASGSDAVRHQFFNRRCTDRSPHSDMCHSAEPDRCDRRLKSSCHGRPSRRQSAQCNRRNTMIPITARAVTASLQVISTSSWCIVLMPLVLCHQDHCSWPLLRSPSVICGDHGRLREWCGHPCVSGEEAGLPVIASSIADPLRGFAPISMPTARRGLVIVSRACPPGFPMGRAIPVPTRSGLVCARELLGMSRDRGGGTRRRGARCQGHDASRLTYCQRVGINGA